MSAEAWLCAREDEIVENVCGGILCLDAQHGKRESLIGSLSGRTLVVCSRAALVSWSNIARPLYPANSAEQWPNSLQGLCCTTYELLCKTFAEHQIEQESNVVTDALGHRERLPVSMLDENARGTVKLYRTEWDRVVFDDAHRLCNVKAKPFSACMALPGRCRWALTETPMRNHGLDDLLSLLRCVGFRYAVRFHHPFCNAYSDLGLVRLIGDFTVRMASLLIHRLPLENPGHYQSCKRSASQLLSQGNSEESVQSAVLAMRRACVDENKLEWVQQQQQQQQGTLLIISSFSSALQSLAGRIQGAAQLRAGQLPVERTAILEGWESGQVNALLMSYRVLSSQSRLSMQNVSMAILLDPWWSTGPQQRLLTALPSGAQLVQLLSTDTIEEHVESVCWSKQRRSNNILQASIKLLQLMSSSSYSPTESESSSSASVSESSSPKAKRRQTTSRKVGRPSSIESSSPKATRRQQPSRLAKPTARPERPRPSSPKAKSRLLTNAATRTRTKTVKATKPVSVRLVNATDKGFVALLKRLNPATHNRLCKGEVIYSYLKRQKDGGAIDAIATVEEAGEIVAYAVLKETNGEWEIAIICSAPGYGKKLLNYIIARAYQSQIHRLILWALPSVINFYRNVGKFRVSEQCEEDPQLAAELDKQKYKQFSSWADAEADREFRALLSRLIRRGFSNPKCKSVLDCESYRMTLCL